MEITPGRAPFSEDEDYTPLRKPKSAANTPTHGNAYATAGGLSLSTGDSAGGAGAGGSGQANELYARTVSPSKLSPFAKEFVPRFGGAGAGAGTSSSAAEPQPQQQQHYQKNYQPYQPQQRYANGYQQQQQQPGGGYGGAQITSLTASVQERLKIGAGGSGTSSSNAGGAGSSTNANKSTANNYYQHPRHNNKHYSNYNHHNQQQQRGGYNHYHQQQHQHHHQQNQHHHHNKHHQQHHHQQQQQQHNNSAANNSQPTAADMESIALDYLQTVVQCLNQNPGQFDTIATRFLTIFDGMENNQYVLSNAMEDIFQESIQNPNFRYMGAKLYNLLHMLNLKRDSLFHTLLKCKLDYHQQEVLQYMQSNQQQKVRETALFLAELYMQLRGDDSRIHLIAENIVYSLKQLLSRESADNVRCICLTLKLAGYDLTADCRIAMQEIIAQLDGINQQAPGKYPLAANVISLQKNNWGRKVSSSNSLSDTSEAAKVPEPLRTSDEPVFYGPDGRELTAEEAEFLCGGAGATGEHDDDAGDGDLDMDFDPEMDEETEKAYKEFCKLNAGT